MTKKDTMTPIEDEYTVDAILRDSNYLKYIDLLKALLDDDKTYKLSEVDSLLANALKKEV